MTFGARELAIVDESIRKARPFGASRDDSGEVRSRVLLYVAEKLACGVAVKPSDLGGLAFVRARGAFLDIANERAADIVTDLVTDPIESAVIQWLADRANGIATGDVQVTVSAIADGIEGDRRAVEMGVARALAERGCIRQRESSGRRRWFYALVA